MSNIEFAVYAEPGYQGTTLPDKPKYIKKEYSQQGYLQKQTTYATKTAPQTYANPTEERIYTYVPGQSGILLSEKITWFCSDGSVQSTITHNNYVDKQGATTFVYIEEP